MNIKILASGSSGNCIAIMHSCGLPVILIDAGIARTKIERRLLEEGIRPPDVSAIFITHAHGDHVKGLPLANKYRIPVYASEGEWKGISGVDEELRRVCETIRGQYEMIEFGALHLYPFTTHHDAYEPLGYAVEDDEGNRCCIVLDTGKVDSHILEMMEGNHIIIEANHEPDMVEYSDYPDKVKARVLSDLGHLSNIQCAAALKKALRGNGERVYLTHLSSNNNTPELARAVVQTELRKAGLFDGIHYFLEVV